MPRPEEYEVLILGSGKSGKSLAWNLAGSGHRTAVVERRWIGGGCPNVNCLPSKNEIWSAKVADLVHHAAQFGLVTGPTMIGMGRVRERKRAMVKDEIADHLALGFTMLGAEAGEVMAAMQTAILGGLPYTLFRDAILTHPTMAEGLNALFATVPAAER